MAGSPSAQQLQAQLHAKAGSLAEAAVDKGRLSRQVEELEVEIAATKVSMLHLCSCCLPLLPSPEDAPILCLCLPFLLSLSLNTVRLPSCNQQSLVTHTLQVGFVFISLLSCCYWTLACQQAGQGLSVFKPGQHGLMTCQPYSKHPLCIVYDEP